MLPINPDKIAVAQDAAQTQVNRIVPHAASTIVARIDLWCASLQTRPIADVFELEAVIRGNMNGIYTELLKGDETFKRKAEELKKRFGDVLFADDLVVKNPGYGVRFMQEGSVTREVQKTGENGAIDGTETEIGNGIHNGLTLETKDVDYLVSYLLQFNKSLCGTLGQKNALCNLAVAVNGHARA